MKLAFKKHKSIPPEHKILHRYYTRIPRILIDEVYHGVYCASSVSITVVAFDWVERRFNVNKDRWEYREARSE